MRKKPALLPYPHTSGRMLRAGDKTLIGAAVDCQGPVQAKAHPDPTSTHLATTFQNWKNSEKIIQLLTTKWLTPAGQMLRSADPADLSPIWAPAQRRTLVPGCAVGKIPRGCLIAPAQS